jgi:ribosomal protein L20
MNPRNLKSHIERALEQSQNERSAHVKIMSSNQQKSGDLSLRKATSSETQALRQFADDWVTRVGNGAYVRNPTYGVLAHGIRTSTMEMDKFEEIRNNILQDNRPFIPRAEIKYVGWLTRNAASRSASSVIIEFTKPEDANKMIDEGLVWQGELFQCERYERQCRLKQCFKCQRYGHIGTQCKEITACGYCAQEHSSRDCPSKADRDATRKCAACSGAHEARNQNCPTRKDELARTEAAYATRSQYHPVPEATGPTTQPEAMTGTLRRRRSVRDTVQSSETMTAREASPPRKGQKRNNTGLPLAMAYRGG